MIPQPWSPAAEARLVEDLGRLVNNYAVVEGLIVAVNAGANADRLVLPALDETLFEDAWRDWIDPKA